MPQTYLQNGRLMANPNQQLSYTTVLEDLRNLLSILGYDAAQFGEHSGKRGELLRLLGLMSALFNV